MGYRLMVKYWFLISTIEVQVLLSQNKRVCSLTVEYWAFNPHDTGAIPVILIFNKCSKFYYNIHFKNFDY
jgi:hypothetical protein